jgi:hypothetical protein
MASININAAIQNQNQNVMTSYERILNLTGEPLAIQMAPGMLSMVAADAASLGPLVGEASACFKLRLYVRTTPTTSTQRIYKMPATPAMFTDAAFLARARDSLVVVRPEHLWWLESAFLRVGIQDVVCVRCPTTWHSLDGTRCTLVEHGFYCA